MFHSMQPSCMNTFYTIQLSGGHNLQIFTTCVIYIYIYVWNTPQETGRPKHKTDWRMNGLCHPGPLCSTSPEGLRELRNSGNEN